MHLALSLNSTPLAPAMSSTPGTGLRNPWGPTGGASAEACTAPAWSCPEEAEEQRERDRDPESLETSLLPGRGMDAGSARLTVPGRPPRLRGRSRAAARSLEELRSSEEDRSDVGRLRSLEAGRSRSCVGELSECAADRGGKGGDKGRGSGKGGSHVVVGTIRGDKSGASRASAAAWTSGRSGVGPQRCLRNIGASLP